MPFLTFDDLPFERAQSRAPGCSGAEKVILCKSVNALSLMLLDDCGTVHTCDFVHGLKERTAERELQRLPSSNTLKFNGRYDSRFFNFRWVKDNLLNVDFLTISRGHSPWGAFAHDVARALNAVSRRIPCLTLIVEFVGFWLSSFGVKFGTEKVILRRGMNALS